MLKDKYILPAEIRVIGQNVLVKTATNVEISMGVAVLSCFRQLRGWTKCVGKTSKIG